jgi:hypothetical protein
MALKRYHVSGCYTQWFECFVYANSKEEAEEMTLNGDVDFMNRDCDDWFIEDVKQVKDIRNE